MSERVSGCGMDRIGVDRCGMDDDENMLMSCISSL